MTSRPGPRACSAEATGAGLRPPPALSAGRDHAFDDLGEGAGGVAIERRLGGFLEAADPIPRFEIMLGEDQEAVRFPAQNVQMHERIDAEVALLEPLDLGNDLGKLAL